MLRDDVRVRTLIEQAPGVKRYKLAQFNRIDCMGYSVGWTERGPVTIVAHRARDDYSCYLISNRRAVTWSHLTINDDETIVEIWRRTNFNSNVHTLIVSIQNIC